MNRNQVEVLFYSDKNVDVLLQIIDQHLTSQYGFKVSQEEEYLLFEIMKIKYDNAEPINKNENIYEYIRELNQETLKTVINIIKKKLNQEVKKINKDPEKEYEKIEKERTIKKEKPKKINFSLETEEDNKVIMKNFEKVLKNREEENQQRMKHLKLKKDEELIPQENNDKPLFNMQDIKTNVEEKIVKLPDEKYEEIQEYTFMVDSRERNNKSSTNPNSYTIQFDKPFKNIVSLELLTTELPITQYVVNDYNNKIKYSTTTYEITKGNYTSTELANQIGIDTANEITATSNDINMKYTLIPDNSSNDIDLSIDDSIAKVIGFNETVLSGGTTYLSPNTYDLFGEKYIVMHVNNFSSNIVSNQEKLEGAFAKIPLTQPLYSVEYFNYEKLRAFKEFRPPLASLDYLNLEFRTYDGNLYDFNGQDHSLTFLIKTKTYRKNMQKIDV